MSADTLHIPLGNWEELSRDFALSDLDKFKAKPVIIDIDIYDEFAEVIKKPVSMSEIMERDMELQIQTEITQAWFNYEAEKKKIAQYKAGVLEDSQKVLDGMVYKYKRGETSILDVLVAQRTYNEVQQEYLETMKGYAASLVALERACGIWDICF